MSNLTAWKFDSVDGADRALVILQDLAVQHLITVQDGAVVSWEDGKKKPKTQQLASTSGAGALGGAFWGLLFGILFFVPLFGMVVGAAMGALSGKFADYGINDEFIRGVRSQVMPGTSALFLLTSTPAPDRAVEAIKAAGLHPELISSNLSFDQEAALRADFGEE